MASLAEKRQETTDELEVPTGGIGDFAMSDDDFAVLEAEEAKKEFGEQGLAQFTAVAKKMAGYGRFGDDSVAHIQTGELIVPLALIENNPALKEQIFKGLRDSGIEDPEQYVVGNPANNINPETGLMEFGFFKKIFKGIKKVLKAVVKIVKIAAPIVLPIVLSMTPLGPILGAALGTGIGTLIKGGSIKSALKAALIAGATGAVFKGFTGPESFGANVKAGFSSPGLRLSETLSGAKTSLGNVFGSEATKLANEGAPGFFSQFSGDVAREVAAAAVEAGTGPGGAFDEATRYSDYDIGTGQAGTGQAGTEVAAAQKPPGFFESAKAAVTPGDDITFGEGVKNMFLPEKTTMIDVLNARSIDPLTATAAQQTAAQAMAAKLSPGFMRSYAPLAGAAALAAGAAGAFKTPKIEQDPNVQYNEDGTITTGADLIAANPEKYLISDLGSSVLDLETGEYTTIPPEDEADPFAYAAPTQYQVAGTQFTDTAGYLTASNPRGPFSRPYVQAAAGGGEIYPRRTGGVAPTEGASGHDSVRAMLMPGEFVMTADAVRGMGRGDPEKGIQTMYSVMRNLEQRGRAA